MAPLRTPAATERGALTLMLIDVARKTIGKHAMLNGGENVVVAVSGGPDSVCLLSVLRQLAGPLNLSLHVAHLDHSLRGEESAAEARFVADLAERFGLPATVERRDVASYCAGRGLGIPAGAREVRYEFLERVADETGAARIALGHTASDQAETLLMRLLRGAGASGLSGIPAVRGRVIRPLIDATREAVLQHLREQDLPFVSDPSNADPAYTRNRIRRELLPLLRSYNPRIVETLAREAALLRDEDEILGSIAAAEARKITSRQEDGTRIEREGFNALPRAVKRRILRGSLSGLATPAPGLSSPQVEEALDFMLTARTGRAVQLPAGIEVIREYDAFIVRTRPLPAGFCVPLAVPGVTAVPEVSLDVVAEVRGHVRRDEEGDRENNVWQALFDYDKIGPFLFLRSRRPGDRFRPSGLSGSKKLQDYFVDRKVPQRLRDRVPLLASGDEIAWVVGMRTDARFIPGPETKRLLSVTVREASELR